MAKVKTSPLYTWNQIRDFFAGEWVELVDYRWDWKDANPTAAVVRHHATDRGELLAKVKKAGAVEDSVILFVGATLSAVDFGVSASL